MLPKPPMVLTVNADCACSSERGAIGGGGLLELGDVESCEAAQAEC